MRAKKHLGQNFLTSSKFVEDIVSAAEIQQGDAVLEIGPGKGVLTRALLDSGANVVAIEKDAELIQILQETFVKEIEEKRLTLVEADVLDIDTATVIQRPYTLVANIPYYITGAIIRKFLSEDAQPNCMTLLLQKEVAERIVSRDGKQSVLSISVAAYGTPQYITKVPARYFSPQPKVDSAILTIRDISKDAFTEISEEAFFNVLKTGFAHKRKLLMGNLSLSYNEAQVAMTFERCAVTRNSRAEDLTREQWLCIARNVTQD